MFKKLFGRMFASVRKDSDVKGESDYNQSRSLLKEYDNIRKVMSTSSLESKVSSVITRTIRDNISEYIVYDTIDYSYEYYAYCNAGIDVKVVLVSIKNELSKSGFVVQDFSYDAKYHVNDLLLKVVDSLKSTNNIVNVRVREKWSSYFVKIPWRNTYQFTSSTTPAVVRRIIKENVSENTEDIMKNKQFNTVLETLSTKIAEHSYNTDEEYWELYKNTVNLVEESQVQVEMFIENYRAMIEAKAITLVPTITTVKSSIEWAVSTRDITVLAKAYEIMEEVKEELDRSYVEVVQYEQEYVEDVNNKLSNHYLDLLEREKEYMERTEELRKVDSALKASTVVLKDIKED